MCFVFDLEKQFKSMIESILYESLMKMFLICFSFSYFFHIFLKFFFFGGEIIAKRKK